jgi:glycerol-3-phosphate acyltransferase PlsY
LTILRKFDKIEPVTIQILAVILFAYLLGSVPFGYMIPRIWNIDIRRHGSGNIGATNVFRTLGTIPGLLVFLLDLLKGTIPVVIAQLITSNPWIIILAGCAAVLGHTFSIFLKFKGGRGAATALGLLLGIAPEIFLGAVIIATIIIITTRFVSLASMTTCVLVTLAFLVLKKPLPYLLVVSLVSSLIIIRHIPNIKRLLSGTEPKIGSSKSKSEK